MWAWLQQFQFEHPARLWWLVAIPLLAYFAWRSSVTASRWRRIASAACRVLIVALLGLAFAGLERHWQSDRQCVVFIKDVSRSVSGEGARVADQFIAEALQSQGPHAALVLPFAGVAGDPQPPSQAAVRDVDELASDPETALRLACATIPADCVPRVVLLTDGRETRGSLAKAALGAGLPVSTVPLPAFAAPEVCLARINAPPLVSTFQDVPLEIVVASNHANEGTLDLLRDDIVLRQEKIKLVIGDNRFRFRIAPGPGDRALFTVRVTASQDTFSENNVGRALVFCSPRPQVLLVHNQPAAAQPLVTALQAADCEVTVRQPDQLAADTAGLAPYDLLVLSDVAPRQLSPAVAARVHEYVHELGGGLIVMGGDKTFASAVYRDSALEKLLPVKAAEVVAAQKKNVLAMMLVVDRSSSMKEEDRMVLAKQAAKQVVGLLEPQDQVGVIAFSNEPQWVVELAPCRDKARVLQSIDTLQPFGQTHMYQAVERAFLALQQTAADRRHMILLTDGVPSPGDYGDVARRIAEAGVTISTVAIGKSAEQDILEDMSRLAKGRHWPCENPADIPKILVQETKTAASETAPVAFPPYVLRALPGLQVASAPKLQGYAPTNPKPQTELLLIAVGGDPLLCWWRYGAGIAVAFTSDATGWQTWQGYGAFWRRLVRHAVRPPPAAAVALELTRSGTQLTATLDDLGADETLEPIATAAPVSFTLTRPGGTQTVQPGRLVARRRYQTMFETAGAAGQFVIEATLGDGTSNAHRAKRALCVDYPDELRLQSSNETLLKAVAATTGGSYNPQSASVFTPDGRTVPTHSSPWAVLVCVAMLLFVTDVAVRRIR
jgi:Mg-chelatase subunit ChlD